MSPSPVSADDRPLHVLWRRLRWRTHWVLRANTPLVFTWWDGMKLALPPSGSAATAFYRTFPSEAIAKWMSQMLEPGMTVVDIGAHVGVYSVLAARLVAPDGVVHALEPQRECVAFLELNASQNALTNVRTHCLAVADVDGELELVVDRRTLGGLAGSSREGHGSMVPACTLRAFATRERLRRIDLLKIDAAGNELAVLRGARELLGRVVDKVICKLYHPDVIADRFGASCAPYATVAMLRTYGFDVVLPDDQAADDEAVASLFALGRYSVPVLATIPCKAPT